MQIYGHMTALKKTQTRDVEPWILIAAKVMLLHSVLWTQMYIEIYLVGFIMCISTMFINNVYYQNPLHN